MGERTRDRQLRDARTAYVSAVRRLDQSLQRFDDSGMAMDPGPDPMRPLEWTEEQRQLVRQVASAFRDVSMLRDEWDGLRRSFQSHH